MIASVGFYSFTAYSERYFSIWIVTLDRSNLRAQVMSFFLSELATGIVIIWARSSQVGC